jgi:hypothetical protein
MMSGMLEAVGLLPLLWLQAAAPGPDWTPAPAPPPTAWARAGARGWRLCDEVGRQAIAVRVGGGPGRGNEELLWSKRARQCPNEPEVLVLAAQEQIIEVSRIGWGPDVVTGLEEVVEEHRARLERAKQWLDAAMAEAKRRGDRPPLESWYLRAYVEFALGNLEGSRRDLAMATRVEDVERWRSDRMSAIVHLFRGDLDKALRLSHQALLDAPPDDRLISRYIVAFVLDRAGDPAAARSMLEQLRREPGHSASRQAFESMLPIHERIYLRAIDHQANRERSNAVRLWEAYLGRPEPVAPDKELARRHQAELEPLPPPVGGPMGGVKPEESRPTLPPQGS